MLVYLAAWIVAALGLMAALAAIEREDRSAPRLEEWAGLRRTQPGLALAVTGCLLSLLGVAPLMGFLGKWTLLRAVLEHSGLRWVAVMIAINFALAAAAYVRVLVVVHASEPAAGHRPGWHRRSAHGRQADGGCCVCSEGCLVPRSSAWRATPRREPPWGSGTPSGPSGSVTNACDGSVKPTQAAPVEVEPEVDTSMEPSSQG